MFLVVCVFIFVIRHVFVSKNIVLRIQRAHFIFIRVLVQMLLLSNHFIGWNAFDNPLLEIRIKVVHKLCSVMTWLWSTTAEETFFFLDHKKLLLFVCVSETHDFLLHYNMEAISFYLFRNIINLYLQMIIFFRLFFCVFVKKN